MKTPNKVEILSAINTIIEQYEDGSIDHGMDTCPMCVAFYTMSDFENGISSGCGSCPNLAYNTKIGCGLRSDIYPKLKYGGDDNTHENDKTIAEYWRGIKTVYVNEPDEDVVNLSPELKTKIIAVADKFL